MPAALESGFFVGKPAWHNLGKVIESSPSIEEAIKLAGLDWEVKVGRYYLPNPHYNPNDEQSLPFIEGTKAFPVNRTTDNKELSAVGSADWTPLQNREAFDFFQPFLDSGMCKLETAGSLLGGEVIWVMAQILGQETDLIPGDQYQNRMLLSNAHSHKLTVRTGFCKTRVVCWNTLNAAHNSEASKLIRIRHSTKAKENLNNVREIMDVANNEFKASIEQLKVLTTKHISGADLRKYVKVYLLGKKDAELAEAEYSTRTKNNIEKCLLAIDQSPGSNLARGTWYQAVQGLNYYENYIRGNKDETRLYNVWFKDSAAKPLDLALELAA